MKLDVQLLLLMNCLQRAFCLGWQIWSEDRRLEDKNKEKMLQMIVAVHMVMLVQMWWRYRRVVRNSLISPMPWVFSLFVVRGSFGPWRSSRKTVPVVPKLS